MCIRDSSKPLQRNGGVITVLPKIKNKNASFYTEAYNKEEGFYVSAYEPDRPERFNDSKRISEENQGRHARKDRLTTIRDENSTSFRPHNTNDYYISPFDDRDLICSLTSPPKQKPKAHDLHDTVQETVTQQYEDQESLEPHNRAS